MNLILASSGGFLAGGILVTIFLLFILFIVLIGIAARYKKCPSDQVLVIFGKTKGDKAARCIHGGAAFIWPVIQDYGFLSLRPSGADRARPGDSNSSTGCIRPCPGSGAEDRHIFSGP